MEVFYSWQSLLQTNEDRINTSSAFNSFKNNYLLIFSIMMAGDWLQGPYVYYLYSVLMVLEKEILDSYSLPVLVRDVVWNHCWISG
ncbi:unnamed protein product [Arabis nemorensis]|uniref:Uncharacterized protein n=1 Tax=Arabis nemorensis TaxID=586526 RepID=A0A565CUE8_9BRAS|nr:unnamed protein product [Arabis nemorensis]